MRLRRRSPATCARANSPPRISRGVLINIVQKITQMCRTKAYFTTPQNLSQFLLMDFMDKTRQIR